MCNEHLCTETAYECQLCFSIVNDNMLNGNSWPKSLHGFRMVVAVLLESYILSGKTSVVELGVALEEACRTPTRQLWVDCFIKPVMIVRLYIRAEHEGIICNFTYIVVNKCHFFWKWKLDNVCITMKKSDGSVIDINALALQLGEECKYLLAVHALTGCDTTSYQLGKGKISALNVLKKNYLNLQCFGNSVSIPKELHKVGQRFFCLLYGSDT